LQRIEIEDFERRDDLIAWSLPEDFADAVLPKMLALEVRLHRSD